MDKSHLFPGEYEPHHHGHAHGQGPNATDRASPFSDHDHENYFSTHLPSIPVVPPGTDNKDPMTGRNHRPRKIVLCFDGTGNKFQGDDSDSNILKIYRMLDRTADDQCKFRDTTTEKSSRHANSHSQTTITNVSFHDETNAGNHHHNSNIANPLAKLASAPMSSPPASPAPAPSPGCAHGT